MTTNLKVIDISHYNPVKSFATVKAAGIVGVICKATQGTGMVDVTYADKIAAAKAAGLLVGAYHFNSGENVTEQINHFLDTVKPDNNTLLALDFEDYPQSNMTLDQCEEFLVSVHKLVGKPPKLYSGNRVKNLLGTKNDSNLGLYPLWIAEYGPRPVLQASWSNYFLWQYSQTGKVPGVSGNIDLNSFNGTDEQLAKEWVS
jgi:lysozyme